MQKITFIDENDKEQTVLVKCLATIQTVPDEPKPEIKHGDFGILENTPHHLRLFCQEVGGKIQGYNDKGYIRNENVFTDQGDYEIFGNVFDFIESAKKAKDGKTEEIVGKNHGITLMAQVTGKEIEMRSTSEDGSKTRNLCVDFSTALDFFAQGYRIAWGCRESRAVP